MEASVDYADERDASRDELRFKAFISVAMYATRNV